MKNIADGWTDDMNIPLPEGVTVATRYPSEFFRSCLARIGHHYLDGQLYGGNGRRWLRVDGKNYGAAIYLSNEGFSGFWVDIYLAPIENRGAG